MKAIPDDIKKYEVVDAKGAVLGRIGSIVAKHLLQGKYVAVVNADNAIISGSKSSIKSKYMIRLNLELPSFAYLITFILLSFIMSSSFMILLFDSFMRAIAP